MNTTQLEDHLMRIVAGENADELIKSLKPAELELFYQIVETIRTEGTSPVVDELWKVDYKRKPPSIEEFIEDPYWLGQVMKPSEDNPGIFPIWRECLLNDFDLDSRIHNLVITGSLGIGKCFAPGTKIMMYRGGYKNVEAVREGDLVMGDDGTPRRVSGLATGSDRLFDVVCGSQKAFTCNASHILVLRHADGRELELSVTDYLIERAVGDVGGFKLIRRGDTDALLDFLVLRSGYGKYYGFCVDGNHRFLIEGNYVCHNSWVGSGIFLYRLVLATLLRNPQNFLGLSKGSAVVYVVLSLSKSVVQETIFGDLQNFMASSPYFLEECHFNPNLKYSDFRIRLGNGIMLTAGSKGQHVIGRNTMGVFLDEGNWRLEANPDMKAYKLYDEVRTRLKNRFQKVAGFLPAISILSSSARDESSFTEKVINDVRSANDEKSEKVYRFAVYEVRQHSQTYKPRWFKVAYGLKNIEPVVLSGFYTKAGVPIIDPEHPIEKPGPGLQVELVPEDYHDAFVRNCKTALQNVCGISTGGSHLLFSSTIDIEKCIELGERSGVTNHTRGNIENIPISDEDDREIWDYLEHKSFLTLVHSQVKPIRHPDAIRFGHIDFATATKAGVAICHLVGMQKIDGLLKNGQLYAEYRLVVEFDFVLGIIAGRTKPISLEKIQKLFFWLRGECGYRFGKITADSYQSASPMQMMAARGFETDILSMDRKKAPYYAFRSGVEEQRVRIARNRTLVAELERLIDGPDKIDHPPEGEKDLSDAACGAYNNAINSENQNVSETGMEPAIHVPSVETDTPGPVIYTPLEPARKSQMFQA